MDGEALRYLTPIHADLHLEEKIFAQRSAKIADATVTRALYQLSWRAAPGTWITT